MVETLIGNNGATTPREMFRFTKQLLKGRWFMLFAAFLIMSGAGATYAFGIYSKEIKRTLGYDQETLNLLGFFKDLGASVGVFSGLIAEVTPTWFVLLVGAALNFFGYFMIWLAVAGHIAKPKVWQMCMYICIGANSQNFANTGSLVPCVKNFPESRGIMVGLLKGFTGLSGAVMNQLYLAIYGNDPKALILLIGWLPAVVSLFFVYTIRPMKVVKQSNERKMFYKYLIISVALALFVMVITIIQKQKAFSHGGYVATATVVCILLFIPLGVAINEELAIWKQNKQVLNSTPTSVTIEAPSTIVAQTVDTKNPVPESSWYSNIFSPPKRGEDYTILQALLSLDMLLVFISVFSGLGTSLSAIDNLGQIGESLGYPSLTISTFVSLVSIWNYFGRVCAGFISEILLSKWGFPRTLVMTVVLVLSCIGDILIAFAFPGSLYVSSVLIGFSYGAQLTLVYTIISELFGLKYYSTLFNCGVLGSPLGSYVFNVRVLGILYDREALKQLKVKGLSRDSVKELTCIGKECYRISFIIMAGVSLVGALCSLVLVMRTRGFYQGDIYKKFREQASGNKSEESEMGLVVSSVEDRKTLK
ncbi:hypothetical protein MKX03_037478 [Papaver bracteatum]|nr:hypothetical protein MKX03_037478 [Papaver bracteatum]